MHHGVEFNIFSQLVNKHMRVIEPVYFHYFQYSCILIEWSHLNDINRLYQTYLRPLNS